MYNELWCIYILLLLGICNFNTASKSSMINSISLKKNKEQECIIAGQTRLTIVNNNPENRL